MKVVEFLRRKNGLSQAELASQILYGRTVVSRLERGQLSAEEIHPRLKDALERRFGLPLPSLLERVPDLFSRDSQDSMDAGTISTARSYDEK